MTLSEDDTERYCTAIRWAQLPENREYLDQEFEVLLQLIELKLDTVQPH
jgi:hypothetical protein